MMSRRQKYITAESPVPQPSAFEVGRATENLKRNKPQVTNKISAELFDEWSRTIRFEINKLIDSIWNKNELPEEGKESIIFPIYKKGRSN
jgi:hypothetical protein